MAIRSSGSSRSTPTVVGLVTITCCSSVQRMHLAARHSDVNCLQRTHELLQTVGGELAHDSVQMVNIRPVHRTTTMTSSGVRPAFTTERSFEGREEKSAGRARGGRGGGGALSQMPRHLHNQQSVPAYFQR
jgi:hypothetical protein